MPTPDELFLSGGHVDLAAQRVRRSDGDIGLTPIEARLLRYMAAHPGRVLSYAELLKEVWHYQATTHTRTVYSTMTRLRNKVEGDPSEPVHIIAVRGAGYRFEGPRQSSKPQLFGRAGDVAEVVRALDRGRLVTLVGPPGIGKSAIARAIAAGLGTGRTVFFVPLTPVASTADVFVAVGRTIGTEFVEGKGADPAAQVEGTLDRIGDAVLVLDGCEHLLPELAPVVERWMSHVRILATSQELLGPRGEIVLRPAPLGEDDGAAMFLVRAEPRGLAAADRADVRAVVRHTGGNPLAIELAAGLVDLMSVKELASELERSPATLSARPVLRDGTPTTLLGAIERSWSRLGPDDRAFLARLTQFRSDFDLDAARAVGGTDAIARLAMLVGKSLVGVVGTNPRAVYRLTDSVRLHAGAHVEPHDRQAYVSWALEVARQGLVAPVGPDGLDAVEAFRPDLLHAFETARAEWPTDAVALAMHLDDLFRHRPGAGQRRRLLDRALEVAPTSGETVRLLLRRSQLFRLHDQLGDAEADLVRAAELARGDQQLEGHVLRGNAAIHLLRLSLASCHALLDRAESLLEETNDPLELAEAWLVRGDALRFEGRVREALEPLERAAAAFRVLGARLRLVAVLPSQARAVWALGEHDRALALVAEAEAGYLALHNRRAAATCAMQSAYLHLGLGDVTAAEADHERAARAFTLFEPLFSRNLHEIKAWSHLERGEIEDAIASFRLQEMACGQAGDGGNRDRARLHATLAAALTERVTEARASLTTQAAVLEGSLFGPLARRYEAAVAIRLGETPPPAPDDPRGPLALVCRAALATSKEARRLLREAYDHPESKSPDFRLFARVLGFAPAA